MIALMLPTIDLYDNSAITTDEVHCIGTDNLLTNEFVSAKLT